MIEYANVHWAVITAIDAGNDSSAIDAAVGLGRFSALSGIGGEVLLERARDLARRNVNKRGEADCVFALGEIARFRDDLDKGMDRYHEALELYKAIGNRQGQSGCLSLGSRA